MTRATLIGLSLSLLGCGSTWQDKLRSALKPTLPAVEAAAAYVGRAKFCESELQQCIAAKANPCPELQQCQKTRRQVVQALMAYPPVVEAIDAALKATEVK